MYKIALFSLLCVVISTTSFAEEVKLFPPLKPVTFKLPVHSCVKNLNWNVSASEGVVEILDVKNNSWQKNSLVWRAVPAGVETIKLRIVNINDKKVQLKFKFQNADIGKVVASSPVDFWVTDAYESYIERLNSVLMVK